MARVAFRRLGTFTAAALSASVTLVGCKSKRAKVSYAPDDTTVTGVAMPVTRAAPVVPPVLPVFSASPTTTGEGVPGSALERAKSYESTGQLWLARLVLEPQALGPDGTGEELELLAKVCEAQSDRACLATTQKRLGRATADAGGKSAPSATRTSRAELEPKVIEGNASRAETEILRALCLTEGDRLCVALCDSKLRHR